MSREDVERAYLDWMYGIVCDEEYSKYTKYRELFAYLHSVDFTYTIPMDGNRFEDGIELRYRFGRENGYPDYVIAEELDTKPCSVLEMMLALAIRCEDTIMDNPDIGNRVGQWFWAMVVSLGLSHMTDGNFDYRKADRIMSHFLDRTYKRNGEGGLFKVDDPSVDMRNLEIWYQMHRYLSEYFEENSYE